MKEKRSILRWKWKRLSRVNPSRYTGWVRGVRERVWQPLFVTSPSHDTLLSHHFHHRPWGQSRGWEKSGAGGKGLAKEWEKRSGRRWNRGRWKWYNRLWNQNRAGWRRPSGDEGEKTKDEEESANHEKPVKWQTLRNTPVHFCVLSNNSVFPPGGAESHTLPSPGTKLQISIPHPILQHIMFDFKLWKKAAPSAPTGCSHRLSGQKPNPWSKKGNVLKFTQTSKCFFALVLH